MITVQNKDQTSLPRSAWQRRAFTLIELLVVTLIIGLLASVVLFALAASQQRAREARTRAQITKIDQLISTRWESYLTRRVPLVIPPGTDRLTSAGLRLDALRELMRLEMPDRRTDVIDNPVTPSLTRPALSLSYQRRANSISGGIANWTPEQQGAECLYMILASIQDGETNGLEFFHQTEIGDVDGDGMPEIVDGWGTPIRWLRWAPGFPSVKQDKTSPDPFDPLSVRADWNPIDGNIDMDPTNSFFINHLLHPLVMSAGPDALWDITFTFDPNTAFHYNATLPLANNPYFMTGAPSIQMGTPTDNNGDGVESYIDNIHNHLIDTVTR